MYNTTNGDSFYLKNWIPVYGSPDYFNACGTGLGNIYTANGGGGRQKMAEVSSVNSHFIITHPILI